MRNPAAHGGVPGGPYVVRKTEPSDHPWIVRVLTDRWGSCAIVTRGRVLLADRLPGLIVTGGSGNAGLVTYSVEGTECEIVTLDSFSEGRGVGTTLIEAVRSAAAHLGCTHLSLVTTNDNLKAMRFYQERGFAIVGFRRNAIEEARKLKPEIPLTGNDGIPIRDEVELRLDL